MILTVALSCAALFAPTPCPAAMHSSTPPPSTRTTADGAPRQTDQAGRTSQSNQSGTAKERKKSNPPPRAVEIENLIGDARTVRAEFTADVLLRLVESDRINDPKWKRELLEEAFRTADGASQPFRRFSVDGEVDTRPGYLTRSLEMAMDAMSLRLRAVRAMLQIDKPRARTLFAEMPPKLPLTRAECEDALVADVSDFYAVLTRVARESFTPAERNRDEDVLFVETYIENVTSPAQIKPLAETITVIGDTPARFERLARAFAKTLRDLDGDDRTFTASLSDSVGGVGFLISKSREQGVAADDLISSAHAYFTRQLTAARCADNVRQAARTPQLFKSLDDLLSESSAGTNDQPKASFAELRPASVGGEMRVFRHWQTPTGARLLFKIKELRFGAGAIGAALSEADRRTPEWEVRLTEFRNELSDWDERAEASAEDYFHQKCVLYWALLELVPPGGAVRDLVLTDYVAFLRKPTIQQDSPLEWFMHIRDLLDLSRRTAPEMPPKRTKLLDAFNASGDPVLRLYANLERLLPPPPAVSPRSSPPPDR
jgi:hypothetical protein